MDAFDLDVEQHGRVNRQLGFTLDVCREPNLVGLFDSTPLTLKIIIISQWLKLLQLLEIGYPILSDTAVNQFGKPGVTGGQPSTLSYTISLVVEFLRPQFGKVTEQALDEQFEDCGLRTAGLISLAEPTIGTTLDAVFGSALENPAIMQQAREDSVGVVDCQADAQPHQKRNGAEAAPPVGSDDLLTDDVEQDDGARRSEKDGQIEQHQHPGVGVPSQVHGGEHE